MWTSVIWPNLSVSRSFGLSSDTSTTDGLQAFAMLYSVSKPVSPNSPRAAGVGAIQPAATGISVKSREMRSSGLTPNHRSAPRRSQNSGPEFACRRYSRATIWLLKRGMKMRVVCHGLKASHWHKRSMGYANNGMCKRSAIIRNCCLLPMATAYSCLNGEVSRPVQSIAITATALFMAISGVDAPDPRDYTLSSHD